MSAPQLLRGCGLLFAAALITSPAAAQSISSCDEISGLVANGQFADALYELDDCRRNVETAYFDGMVEVVNVPIAGLQPSGGGVEGAMGINVVTIRHGDFESQFTSGSGASENPMSGLASLAGLSAALGVRQEGVEEVRLGRRLTGQLEDDNGRLTMTVGLDDGMLVTKGSGDRDQLVELVTEMIQLLEDYIEG